MTHGQVTRYIQVADGLWLRIDAPDDADHAQHLADDLVDGARALLGLPPRPIQKGKTL